MDSPTLLRLAFADLHKELLEDVSDVSRDDLFWQPGPGVNHIGFLLWHIVRDEDAVISQSVLGQPELWLSDDWATRFEMDETEQGTGMEPGRLPAHRYNLEDLLEYARAVWQRTDDALDSLTAERLDETLLWTEEWSLANLLTTGCLSHGWVHLGEIRQLRGLRGWKFRE